MIDCVPETADRFLDGGSLLHRIPWQHGIREEDTIIIHTVVSFTAETDFSGKKEEILSKDTTKQRVIRVIRVELRER